MDPVWGVVLAFVRNPLSLAAAAGGILALLLGQHMSRSVYNFLLFVVWSLLMAAVFQMVYRGTLSETRRLVVLASVAVVLAVALYPLRRGPEPKNPPVAPVADDEPAFYLDLGGPVEVWRVRRGDGPPNLGAMFIVRVTNEGSPGRPFDWQAFVVPHGVPDLGLPPGVQLGAPSRFQIVPVPLGAIAFVGSPSAMASDANMIWSRAARSMNRGESEDGYFWGVLPPVAAPTLHGSYMLEVVVYDHRRRPFRRTFSLGPFETRLHFTNAEIADDIAEFVGPAPQPE